MQLGIFEKTGIDSFFKFILEFFKVGILKIKSKFCSSTCKENSLVRIAQVQISFTVIKP